MCFLKPIESPCKWAPCSRGRERDAAGCSHIHKQLDTAQGHTDTSACLPACLILVPNTIGEPRSEIDCYKWLTVGGEKNNDCHFVWCVFMATRGSALCFEAVVVFQSVCFEVWEVGSCSVAVHVKCFFVKTVSCSQVQKAVISPLRKITFYPSRCVCLL